MNPAIMQLKITKTEQEKKLKDLELKLIMRLNDISSRVIPYFEHIVIITFKHFGICSANAFEHFGA